MSCRFGIRLAFEEKIKEINVVSVPKHIPPSLRLPQTPRCLLGTPKLVLTRQPILVELSSSYKYESQRRHLN